MQNILIKLYKEKKQKKEKLVIISSINNITLNIFNDYDIDIIRFDLEEFAQLYGYKDPARISSSEIIPLLKNLNKTKTLNEKRLIAVDVPLIEIYGNENYSLNKIIEFYKDTNADILSLNAKYNIVNLISKLSKINIPVIAYIKKTKGDNNPNLDEIKQELMDLESNGAIAIILNDFEPSFVQNIKNTLLIPVISNNKQTKNDGFYAKFSTIFGLISSSQEEYLNIFDLIKDSTNDLIIDIK